MELKFRKPRVVQVNNHVWLLNDSNEATGYVIAGSERAIVVDTMIGLVDVPAAARLLTDKPLVCVNTHGHFDHIGGNWAFDRPYLHKADFALAAESYKIPEVQEAARVLNLSFPSFEPMEEGTVFDAGGVSLEVLALPGHTAGSVVLLDRADRILFTGDAIGEQVWLQLPESLPVQVQLDAMKRLKPLRPCFDTILTGHSRRPAGAELFDSLLAALEDLAAGNTAHDEVYEWFGGTALAHPYGEKPRRIVYPRG